MPTALAHILVPREHVSAFPFLTSGAGFCVQVVPSLCPQAGPYWLEKGVLQSAATKLFTKSRDRHQVEPNLRPRYLDINVALEVIKKKKEKRTL